MKYKHWLIIAIILAIFALNFYCNNIIINTFYYFSSLPRLIAITIGVLFLVFPRFMEDIDFKQFVPNTGSSTNQPFIPNVTPTLKKRNVSQKTKKGIAAKQKWKCNYCKKMLDAEYKTSHITPLHEGGTNFQDNLQILCSKCHSLTS